MKKIQFFLSFTIIFIELLLVCHADPYSSDFHCSNRKGNVPELPENYGTDIKIYSTKDESTVEIIYARNNKERNELIEFMSSGRHVKYITRKNEKSTLYIEYQENKQPKCEVLSTTDKIDFLKPEDTGVNDIILKTLEVILTPTEYNIYSTGPAKDESIYALRYEGCLSEPRINISMTFATKNWKHPYGSSIENNINYPEIVDAEIGNNRIRAYYSVYMPSEPDNTFFQPPVEVFCKGFRTKKTPPKMPNYFSYRAEIVNYVRTKVGIIPMLTRKKVYYDYNDKISRIEFNDLLYNTDLVTKTIAQKKSIIHDYNSGVQYIIDSETRKCYIDHLQETFDAISFDKTKDNKMLTGDEFFWLDDAYTSYNGQFPFRGVLADVYTALRVDPKTKNSYIISWFFSAETAQVAENENVGKNVLLSMSVRQETELDKEKSTEISFYDFVSDEPDTFNFDVTNCYNESSSRTLIFTFPANESLRGSEKLVGRLINIAIKDVTGIRKQRIYTRGVVFSGKYMYYDFSLLENSPIKNNFSNNEISLDIAEQKLKDNVKNGDFVVKIEVEDDVIFLKPEPDGLNVFAGNRPITSQKEGYHEGSVIALTIGMLCLGLLLGAVAVNLIISRKHGISLFQKSGFIKGFGNPLNEFST